MKSQPLALGLGRLARFALPVLALAFAAVTSFAAVDPASQKIDALVDAGLAKAGEKPNAPASDEVFMRRLYLDVIGRIPTVDEATAFLNDRSADKRSQLIAKLLASDGYTQNWFNYWADILRVKSDPTEGAPNGSGDVYASWLKEQLKYNTPYDKLVHSMLTAQGYLWDNGAIGYYMRDAGMPLDNMANTCQVFLGTRVACAQCHNHPFDDYKQRDFYEMAAYTCGVQTRVNSRQIIAEATGKKSKRDQDKDLPPGVREQLDDLLEPLTYGTRQNPDMKQKLPPDFRGDPKNPSKREGMPNEEVKAQPVFSREKIKTGKGILDNYANWMTSPDNPTFTTVIANRLWKSAFGIGLIEPVDDIKKVDLDKTGNDASKLASNPQLMSFLTQHMKACKYDMKKFLSTIYNSAAYQREATTKEVLSVENYAFAGPIVRRMSAEQLWDSMVTLVIPTPDERKRPAGYSKELSDMKAKAAELQEKLRAGNGKALLQYATVLANVKREFDGKADPIRRRLNEARNKGDKGTMEALQKELDAIESARFDANKKAYDESNKSAKSSSSPFSGKPPMMKDDKAEMMMKKEEPVSAADEAKFAAYDKKWIRASEMPSPAPGGHFLREFGQSERITIQGANTDSSVTQALAMLNGPLFGELTANSTQLGKVLGATKTVEEKRDQLFLALLGRLPNDREKEIFTNAVKGDNQMNALRKVTWALLNTREFTFIK